MRINIVCRDMNEDKILPRLAKALANGTGWSLGEEPLKGVDLNYWMIYIDLAERHSDWRATARAAYFSHYEEATKFKTMWWDTALRLVNGVVVTAPQYGEMIRGSVSSLLPLALARPPVDKQFAESLNNIYISDHSKLSESARPRVGFSGFVDRSGRKGEHLVAMLRDEFSGLIEFIACGHGWPVPTQMVEFGKLPSFYRSLDLYVCTSTTEGIPMPPLEAIACGTPVLLPRGVGMLDSLPSNPNILYYKAGNYDDLREQMKSFLFREDKRVYREKLTHCVHEYTERSWQEDHARLFEQAIAQHYSSNSITLDSSVEQESDRHGKRGVLYVAYGGPARRCADAAMQSVKETNPELEIALVSSEPIGVETVFIQHEDEDIGGRSAKTKIDQLAPKDWQYILYLDSDTEVLGDLSFLFEALEDGWDLCICKNPAKYHTIRYMSRSDNQDECQFTYTVTGTDQILQLNGGVFSYQRNARTKEFFQAWHDEWKRWGKRDQAALIRALWDHPLKLYLLTNQYWNCITRYENSDDAVIKHYPMTARRWRGVLHGRLDGDEAWQAAKKFESQ